LLQDYHPVRLVNFAPIQITIFLVSRNRKGLRSPITYLSGLVFAVPCGKRFPSRYAVTSIFIYFDTHESFHEGHWYYPLTFLHQTADDQADHLTGKSAVHIFGTFLIKRVEIIAC
jgi:hypothetical protein